MPFFFFFFKYNLLKRQHCLLIFSLKLNNTSKTNKTLFSIHSNSLTLIYNWFPSSESGFDNYTTLDMDDFAQSLYNGGFDVTRDTKIVIHGWYGNGTNFAAQTLVEGERKIYNPL